MKLVRLRFLWRSDLHRYYGKSNLSTFLRMLFVYWEAPGAKYAFLLRLVAYLRVAMPRPLFTPLYVIMRIVLKRYEYKWHIQIPPAVRIGSGIFIGHFGDIVIHGCVILGANCNISQGVTIGQSSRGPYKGTPILGDNVFIGPGAKIFGRIHIGNNVAIGANCVVTRDIPDNAVVVGVPARIISYKGSEGYILNTDYLTPSDATLEGVASEQHMGAVVPMSLHRVHHPQGEQEQRRSRVER